jgi:ABC-type glycerol-3-phosphate transport system substrate-binding protein
MTKLQIIISFLSILAAVVVVMIFSGALPGIPSINPKEKSEIVFWGTLPQFETEAMVQEFSHKNPGIKANYREIKKDSYEKKLIEALAEGRGPDVFFLTQDRILKHQNKIFPVSYDDFSVRQFRDLFFDGADIYVSREGIIGFPIFVDPLILYWNKSLFRDAAIPKAPETWDEFLAFSEKLTKIDENGNILRSGAALGHFGNINHAKDIISLLILQTDNPIVSKETLKVLLGEFQEDLPLKGTETALRFFGEFRKTGSKAYSWNLLMPQSADAFIEGRLAMYLGYASEYPEIKKKSPHLDFDAAVIPQVRGGKNKLTFGRITGLVIAKQSRAKKSAFLLTRYLLEQDNQKKLIGKNFLASPLRSLLFENTKDPVFDVFNKSAIIAKGWLDPDPEETDAIFRSMTEDYLSGRKDLERTVMDAKIKMENLIREKTKTE